MYFRMLKKLAWVVATGEEEVSTLQDYYEDFEPRRYYRLTNKGIEAPDDEWANPHRTLYPQFDLEYYRVKRRMHHYTRKAPTLSRKARSLTKKTLRLTSAFNSSQAILVLLAVASFARQQPRLTLLALYAFYSASPFGETPVPVPWFVHF